MLNKNDIIKAAMLKLGLRYKEEDYQTDENWKTALFLLDEVVKDTILSNTLYYFNGRIATLARTGEDPVLIDKKIYFPFHLPADYRAYIYADAEVEILGDRVYSRAESVAFKYTRDQDIKELPVIAKRLVILSLAYELCQPLNKTKLMGAIYGELEEEKQRLQYSEQGFNAPFLEEEVIY